MANLQRRMVSDAFFAKQVHALTTSLQLSRDEEASVGGTDLEVRREDQDKINKFSRLHQKEELLQERLKVKTVRYRNTLLDSITE